MRLSGFDIVMAIKLIVAKVLREELSAIGIRSLTVDESETIASRIFARITELELAARDFHSTSPSESQRDGPRVMSVYDPGCVKTAGQLL